MRLETDGCITLRLSKQDDGRSAFSAESVDVRLITQVRGCVVRASKHAAARQHLQSLQARSLNNIIPCSPLPAAPCYAGQGWIRRYTYGRCSCASSCGDKYAMSVRCCVCRRVPVQAATNVLSHCGIRWLTNIERFLIWYDSEDTLASLHSGIAPHAVQAVLPLLQNAFRNGARLELAYVPLDRCLMQVRNQHRPKRSCASSDIHPACMWSYAFACIVPSPHILNTVRTLACVCARQAWSTRVLLPVSCRTCRRCQTTWAHPSPN